MPASVLSKRATTAVRSKLTDAAVVGGGAVWQRVGQVQVVDTRGSQKFVDVRVQSRWANARTFEGARENFKTRKKQRVKHVPTTRGMWTTLAAAAAMRAAIKSIIVLLFKKNLEENP